MPITPAELELLATTLTTATPATPPSLRAALGGRPVVMLAAEDLSDETPYRVLPGYDLHLFDGSAHCPQLTRDPSAATGFIVARQS